MSDLQTKEEELKARGQRWENWPRSTVEEKNRAEEYYCNEIMPLLMDVFIEGIYTC